MEKKKKFFDSALSLILIPVSLLMCAVSVYGIYSFYYDYDRYMSDTYGSFVTDQMTSEGRMNLIIYTIGIAVVLGLFAWFIVSTGKKKMSVGKKAISIAASVLCGLICQWGVTVLVHKHNPHNYFAVTVGVSLLAVQYAVMLFLLFFNLSGKGAKILNRILAVVLAAACISTSAYIIYPWLQFNWLYPVRAAMVKLDGVKTADDSITYDFARSSEKVAPYKKLGNDETIDIALAKNEWEGFQLVLASTEKGRKVTVSATDFVNEKGDKLPVTVGQEYYIETLGYGSKLCNYAPDAIVPIDSKTTVELKKNYSQTFYFETHTTADTAPGNYTAEVTVADASGKEILKKEVTAKVWSFALPEASYSSTAIQIDYSRGGFLWGVGIDDEKGNEEAAQAAYKKYYDYFIDRRINPYDLPYDIMSKEAEEYMNDPRVKNFRIPVWNRDTEVVDEELVKQYYNRVQENPDWAKKAYFYVIDEPDSSEQLQKYIDYSAKLKQLCPGYNMITPFAAGYQDLNGEKVFRGDIQVGRSNLICPLSWSVVESDGSRENLDKLHEIIKNNPGSELWWYVCCYPTGDYNNLFISQDSIQHRLLFWQQRQLDITGFLYYSATGWGGDAWNNSKTWLSDAPGDGRLFYTGRNNNLGTDKIIPTVRFTNIVDGLEDYDYLTMAAEIKGEDWMQAKIAEITTSVTEYKMDYELLETLRREIASELEKADIGQDL